MANIKYELSVTDNQIEMLIQAFETGCPVDVALQYSKINKATYYYWLAVANVVKRCKENDFMKKQSELVNDGISISDVSDAIDFVNQEKESKATIDAYIEPNPKSILKYRNNKRYKEFADKVYEIIERCDFARSKNILDHLEMIKRASRTPKISANSSQWYLERALPEVFGKTNNNANTINMDDENADKKVKGIQIEFINPETRENQDRVRDMEKEILNELNGGKA